MIASLRGAIVLAVVALVLALVLAFDSRPKFDPEMRLIMPLTRVTDLRWTRPRGPNVHLVRTDSSPWQFVDPNAPADAHAVDAVLSTLAGARWHRRGVRPLAGTIHSTLTLDNGTTIQFGDPLHGADQAWIVVDDEALLVDGWIARALDPDPLQLRERAPLAGVQRLTGELAVSGQGHHLAYSGHPRRSGAVMVRAELARAFDRACERLEIVRLPDAPLVDAPEPLTITASELGTVLIGGLCPGDPHLVMVRATQTGDGCADPAAVRDLIDAITALEKPSLDVVEYRPAPIERPTEISFGTAVISLAKRPTVAIGKDVHAADPDRVAELVAALAEPATSVLPVVAPFRPERKITVTNARGERIDLVDDGHVLMRQGEDLTLQPTPAVRAILERPPTALFDEARWLEDPSTLTRIVLDGVTYRAGAVVGEWTREPAGPIDQPLVAALAQTLAQLRAPAREGSFRIAHTLVVTFAPPVGAGSIHTLELGQPTADGCPARVDGAAITAPAALCTAVAAVAAAK